MLNFDTIVKNPLRIISGASDINITAALPVRLVFFINAGK
jgi:hypothetical protein